MSCCWYALRSAASASIAEQNSLGLQQDFVAALLLLNTVLLRLMQVGYKALLGCNASTVIASSNTGL